MRKGSHVQINEAVPKFVWVFWIHQEGFQIFGIESSNISLYWLSKIRYFWGLRIYEKLLRTLDTTSLKIIRNSDLWFLSPHLEITTLQKCLKLINISYYSFNFTHWHSRTICDMHGWNRVIYKWVISFRSLAPWWNRIVCRTIFDGIHTIICYRLDKLKPPSRLEPGMIPLFQKGGILSESHKLVPTSADDWFTKGYPCVTMSMW